MKKSIIFYLLLLIINSIIFLQGCYFVHASSIQPNADLEWRIKEGDEFIWTVTKSKSENYDFLPEDSNITIEITKIKNTPEISSLEVILKKIDADKEKKTTILDEEMFQSYNHTDDTVQFYTAFFDLPVFSPETFGSFFDAVYDYYVNEEGFTTKSVTEVSDELTSVWIADTIDDIEIEWLFNDDYVCDEMEFSENSDLVYKIELQKPEEPEEEDYTWVIITIIVIAIAVGVSGMVYLNQRGKLGKPISLKRKTLPQKSQATIKAKQRSAEDSTLKPKKSLDNLEVAPTESVSDLEQKEIEQTESEMDIEKKELICIVHRGPILGTMYACPNCQTLYCQKCATTLREKGEKCWTCSADINITSD